MKWLLNFLGGLLILSGGVWFLQGIGVLPGSYMSGQMQWAINGTIMALIGGGLVYWANRPRKQEPPQ